VRARLPAPSGAEAYADVTLDGADVVLQLTPGRGVVARGRFVFESDTPPSQRRPSTLFVETPSADPDERSPGGGSAREDLTFELTGLFGSRFIRASPPQGWTLKAVRIGNTDVTDASIEFGAIDVEGIEIVLTDRITTVSGLVAGTRGEPLTDATVVLFAEDPARWMPGSRFIAVARPDRAGRFRHAALPPGAYMAVAVEYLEPGEETNPETLRLLRELGTRFTLEEGESRELDVTLSSLP
jgi:hypothetical protein